MRTMIRSVFRDRMFCAQKVGEMATWPEVHRWAAALWPALAGPVRKWRLRRFALGGKDEQRRLDAAQQLDDQKILRRMAIASTDAAIRTKAAAAVEHQPFLAAIALNACDIELGRAVVDRIQHDLLLRRVARSARQEATRLAAARRLKDASLLKRIARRTADIELCWEVARELNDLDLMVDVALYKPSSQRSGLLRLKARTALLLRLDDYGRQGDENALLTFILFQAYLPFKLYAFLCLPDKAIHRQLLQHMASQQFHAVSMKMTHKMLAKIEAAGWRVRSRNRNVLCAHCNGKGLQRRKSICAGHSSYESEIDVCAECNGKGRRAFFVARCTAPHGRDVEFRLPTSFLRGQGH